MKEGDLIKVKDCCAFGNVYMQQIAGWVAVLIKKENRDRMKILTLGKIWYVCHNDIEAI